MTTMNRGIAALVTLIICVLPLTASAGSGSDCGGPGLAVVILPILGVLGTLGVIESFMILLTLVAIATDGDSKNLTDKQRRTYRKLSYCHFSLLAILIITVAITSLIFSCERYPGANSHWNFDDYLIALTAVLVSMVVMSLGVACFRRGSSGKTSAHFYWIAILAPIGVALGIWSVH